MVSKVILLRRLAFWTIVWGVFVSSRASAEDVQLFVPPAGRSATFGVDSPDVPSHLQVLAALAGSFASDPLVWRSRRDGAEQAIVSSRSQADLLLALGLFGRFELGLAVPWVRTGFGQGASSSLGDTAEYGVGDLRVSLKVPALREPLRVAGRLTATLPTGRASDFAGSGYRTLAPALLVASSVGGVDIAFEGGYRVRRREVFNASLETDDELFLGVGATAPVARHVAAVLEAQGRTGVGGRNHRANEDPVDANAGVRIELGPRVGLDVGAGTGLLAGYGAPSYRVLAIVRYAAGQPPCRFGPEDYDGYEDSDYCADPDNDRDGLIDRHDRCPNDAEDRDGFADRDGCPDIDNDGDGVLDAVDKCPNDSEDQDGFEDEDGCPDLDNDQDGVPDGLDRCPMDPEDLDRFEDEDGCPEPGPNQPMVTVTDTRILISERVYFDFDRDTIRSVSLPLLDQVAGAIRALGSKRRVRVEGYTDDAGTPAYNLDLSYRRARAVVDYLVTRGIARERLDYVGYGRERGVAPNDTPEGRALNRRVEFTIVEPEDRVRTKR